jgi:hypothetical protein
MSPIWAEFSARNEGPPEFLRGIRDEPFMLIILGQTVLLIRDSGYI